MRTIVLTGALRGLGWELSQFWIQNPHVQLWLNYVQDTDQSRRRKAQLQQINPSVRFWRCDLRDCDAIKAGFEDIVGASVQIDLLVNNAGFSSPSLLIRASEQALEDHYAINSSGAFYLSCLYADHAASCLKGHVLNVASFQALAGEEGSSLYAMSKAALIGWTQAMAALYGPKRIQFNVVLPGYMKTDMTKDLSVLQEEAFRRRNVLGEFAPMEEIVQCIDFLSQRTHVSGQVWNLDSRVIPYV